LSVLDRDVIEVGCQPSAYSGHIDISYVVDGNGDAIVPTVIHGLVADNPILLACLIILYRDEAGDIHVI